MKYISRLLVMLMICGIAHSEVKMEPPNLLLTARAVSVVLDDDLEKGIVIYEKGVWKNKDLVKTRSKDIRAIVFRFSDGRMPHLVQVHEGKVFFMHKAGPFIYKFTIQISEFLKEIFPDYNKEMQAEPAGADQPATKPADKVPAEVKPSNPASKDSPR
jgi:hypothetical protein